MLDFDTLGRLYAELDHERQQHRLSIAVLRRVVSGELDPSRIEVDDNGWTILPEVVGPIDVDDLLDAAAIATGGEE